MAHGLHVLELRLGVTQEGYPLPQLGMQLRLPNLVATHKRPKLDFTFSCLKNSNYFMFFYSYNDSKHIQGFNFNQIQRKFKRTKWIFFQKNFSGQNPCFHILMFQDTFIQNQLRAFNFCVIPHRSHKTIAQNMAINIEFKF